MSKKGSGRPLIVPVFIPNQGCPHRCIFCHQENITSQKAEPMGMDALRDILETALNSPDFDPARNPEIAFYGGTFTRLPLTRITRLLETVRPYLDKGFRSLRISTRPDALDDERIRLIRDYGVTTVELGAQSMDNRVLEQTRRGHTAEDTIEAVALLRRQGFKVGIQLMPGLPGDSGTVFSKTVDRVIALRPDMVRLYPTLVIRGTELAGWYREGRYQPLDLEEAVARCAAACHRLESEGIPVIRIGLMSSPSLLREGQILAGPWHESFGFLVRTEIHQKGLLPFLPDPGRAGPIRLRVPPREIPLVRGYRNRGLRFIEERIGSRISGVVGDPSVPRGRVLVEEG